MTYKQLQTSHEIRMWITQIVVPAVVVGAIVWNLPKVKIARKKLSDKLTHNIKSSSQKTHFV